VGQCAHARRVERPFICVGETDGGARASSRRRGAGVKERRAATETHRASSVGNAVGGPAGASADSHTRV
jgi:hypothetical protein